MDDSENHARNDSTALVRRRCQAETAVALVPHIGSPSNAATRFINAEWIDADVAVDRLIRCEQATVKVYICAFTMRDGHECGTSSRKLKEFTLQSFEEKNDFVRH